MSDSAIVDEPIETESAKLASKRKTKMSGAKRFTYIKQVTPLEKNKRMLL
ncbi:hypothetical protein CHCC20375_4319 [Bacillus licheniformis]|nr:hypothetical protein CHCC20375_4319 [Bacillus licheniformis]